MKARKVLGVIASTAAVISTALVIVAPSANAEFHLMKITEIYAGSAENPSSQFIELRMYSSGQSFVDGHSVEVFDGAGTSVGTFTFEGNVPNGANQAPILIATSAAATEFDRAPDLAMAAVIPASAGAVCWAGSTDCAAWGNYSGNTTHTGAPFNDGGFGDGGIPAGSSMTRKLGANGTLENADDTNQSSADFEAAAPTPTNNTGADNSTTTTTTTTTTMPGGSTTTTMVSPPPEEYERTVSLRVEDGAFRGRVRVPDDIAACRNQVPVRLQKKRPTGWDTVARRTTSTTGMYAFDASRRTGRFRTRAPRVDLGEDACLRATSRVITRG